MLNTWTLCFLICVIMPSPTLNAAVGAKDNESAKTMYEAVVQKCPKLEKTPLQENLKDIFTKNCVDWPKINATSNALSKEERGPAACLVLYESLLSFCASFGDHDIAKYKGLIPTTAMTSTYTANTICISNKFKDSLNKPEHNIAQFLEPTNCLFICGEFGKNGLVLKEDTCKLAFYFATFDVNKLITDSDKLHQATNKLNAGSANQPEVPKPDDTKADGIKPAVNAKPQHTSNDEQNVALIQSALDDSKKKSDPQANSPKGVQPLPIENQIDKNEAVIVKPEGANIEDVKGKGAKNESKVAPETSKKEAAGPINPPQEANDDEDASNPKGDENIPSDQEEFQGDEEDDHKDYHVVDHEVAKHTEEKGPINKSFSKEKPSNTVQDTLTGYNSTENMDGDSYVFSYFVVFMCLFIIGYVGYHNRQKIFALLLEGKRGKRAGRPGRRPNSANYHKLDSNLEEAVSSSCTKNVSNVIY